VALVPAIAGVLDALEGLPHASLIRMSGSGATCFALFETDAARDDAATALRAVHPDWWIWPSELR